MPLKGVCAEATHRSNPLLLSLLRPGSIDVATCHGGRVRRHLIRHGGCLREHWDEISLILERVADIPFVPVKISWAQQLRRLRVAEAPLSLPQAAQRWGPIRHQRDNGLEGCNVLRPGSALALVELSQSKGSVRLAVIAEPGHLTCSTTYAIFASQSSLSMRKTDLRSS